MSERPGVDANSSKERVETSDDLPGRILSVIYVGEVDLIHFQSQKDYCITLQHLLSLVRASQPTIESILDSFCSLGIVRESERKTFCLSEKYLSVRFLSSSVHIPNLSYTNSSVSTDEPYSSLLKVCIFKFPSPPAISQWHRARLCSPVVSKPSGSYRLCSSRCNNQEI